METIAHRRLKQLAMNFLRSVGCMAATIEVQCPISRYRVDAAGYADTHRPEGSKRRHRCPARTIVIECKQSRADFLRDDKSIAPLLRRRSDLEGIRRSIEQERIRAEEPELRESGSSLFPDMEQWDFAASRLPSYRKTLVQLERVEARLYGHTKFARMARYRLADHLYIAAPRGLVRHAELPADWGLLECPPEWLDEHADDDRLDDLPQLHVAVEAPSLESPDVRRQRLLRNIAVKASFAAERRPHRLSARS